MGILGIENRTENWRTAYHFSDFFKNDAPRTRLQINCLHPTKETSPWKLKKKPSYSCSGTESATI